jgi:hypothetical protein
MGIPELILEQELAVDEARQQAGQAAREADAAADATELPSCSAALSARSIEELVIPI